MSVEAKRTRKSPLFFATFKNVERKKSERKDVEIVEGSGAKLGDNEHFCNEIDKVKGDDEEVKLLHSLLFSGVVGRKLETKKHIRAFSGFDSSIIRNDKIDNVTNNKKWTNAALKIVLGWIGLERGGTRDELIVRLVDFLMKPTLTKTASSIKKKRKVNEILAVDASETVEEVKKETKIAPTALMAYAEDRREAILAANPTFTPLDVAETALGFWKTSTKSQKKEYVQMAAATKTALLSAGYHVIDAVEGEDNYFNYCTQHQNVSTKV